jgi:uncharacterized membrane protein YfhO
MPGVTLVFSEGQTKVYENKNSLPRVYLAEHIEIVAKGNVENQLEALFKESNKTRPAVVSDPIPVLSIPLTGDESVGISSYLPTHISIVAQVRNPRLMVILNSYDSRIKAQIDGVSTDVLRVNYLFSGIVVPQGSHTIEISY